MLPVAVLAGLRVLGHHHQGFDPSVQPNQGQRDLLRLESGLFAGRLGPGDVRKPQEKGKGAHACGPNAVDGLVGSPHFGGGHIGEGAGIAALRGIDGIHAPQKDPFIVGMGGDDEKVRSRHGGLGLGQIVRDPAGPQYGQFTQVEGLLPGGELHPAASLRQFDDTEKPVRVQIGGLKQLSVPVKLPQRHPGVLGPQTKVQGAQGLFALGLDQQHVMGSVGVVGQILSVMRIQSAGLRAVLDEGETLGDVFRFGLRFLRPDR